MLCKIDPPKLQTLYFPMVDIPLVAIHPGIFTPLKIYAWNLKITRIEKKNHLNHPLSWLRVSNVHFPTVYWKKCWNFCTWTTFWAPYDGYKWSYKLPIDGPFFTTWVSLVFKKKPSTKWSRFTLLGVSSHPENTWSFFTTHWWQASGPTGIAVIQLPGLDQVETSCLGSFIHQVLRTGTEAGFLHGDQQGVSNNGGVWMDGWDVICELFWKFGEKMEKCWENLGGECFFFANGNESNFVLMMMMMKNKMTTKIAQDFIRIP